MKNNFSRQQRTTAVYGVLCLVLILVILQLWLLTATMNAFLGGDDAVIWPAAIVSFLCFLGCAYLIRTLSRMDKAEAVSS
jgi:uncharacterized membrane protein